MNKEDIAAQAAVPVGATSDEMRQCVRDAVAEAMSGLYHCGRVWSAWGVGTMSESDFSPANEDDDIIESVAEAAINAMVLVRAAASQAAPAQQSSKSPSRAALIECALRSIIEADDNQALTQQLIEVGRAALAAPAQQTGEADTTASASIDSDPEFQRLVEYWRGEPYGTRSFENAWAELVAYIDSRATLAPVAAQQAAAERFFMDHGVWHDRVTGQHMWTQDEYDAQWRDMYKAGQEDAANGFNMLTGKPIASEAAAKAPAAQAEPLAGRMVSVAIDTGNEDADEGKRIFAQLTGETASDGMTLIADEVSRNFAASPASTPEASQQAADVAEPVLYVRAFDLENYVPGSAVVTSKLIEGDWNVPLYTAPSTAAAATTSEDARDAAPIISGYDIEKVKRLKVQFVDALIYHGVQYRTCGAISVTLNRIIDDSEAAMRATQQECGK